MKNQQRHCKALLKLFPLNGYAVGFINRLKDWLSVCYCIMFFFALLCPNTLKKQCVQAFKALVDFFS